MNTEEKIDALATMVRQLTQTVAELKVQNRENTQTSEKTLDDKTQRVDIPEFDGRSINPDVYLDWEASIERYFEYKETQEENNTNWPN